MIEGFELILVRVPLVSAFRTSFGVETAKECILVRALTSDGHGWGECVASPSPDYSHEFNDGAWVVMRDHLIPSLLAAQPAAEAASQAMAWVRGHHMAKAALEMALLDAECRATGMSLAERLGGTRSQVEVGVSIGIQDSDAEMVERVAMHVEQGYRRIKLKIQPEADLGPVSAVRDAFPEIALSVDANGAYDPETSSVFEAMEEFGLLMIEQPLAPPDLWEHARLQARLVTPLCLDESITSESDARAALDMGAGRIINVKQGRVGGLLSGRSIHDLCRGREVPVWCGGMLETGVGRAGNLALASLPGFSLPGDISASIRYFQADLTEPFEITPDGMMTVPTGPGLGVEPLAERLAEATLIRESVGKE